MNTSLTALISRFETSWQSPLFQTIDDDILSYGDIWCTARKLSKRWSRQGLKPGDIIAFKLQNSFKIPCIYLACAIGGFVACPLVPSLRSETIVSNLNDVQPAFYIEDEFELEPIPAVGSIPLAAFDSLSSDIPFLIMFSSGSTGKNKAICHCLGAVTGSARAFSELSGFDNTTSLYHVLPMTYMAGFLNAMLAVIMAGGKIIEGPQFSLETVADFWRRPLATDANTLSVIPPIAAAVCRLTRNTETIQKVTAQFRQVQCTSQAIHSNLRKQFFKKFGLPLQDCYGMTELGGPLSLQNLADAQALNNQSDPLPDLKINLGDNAELWISSPYSMLGYLKAGSLTNPFNDKGFLDTGDLADMANNQIEITGRIKDIIIRGGINTSPARIESVMSGISGITEVAVIGVPHSFWGEEIVACIVGNENEADIMRYCRENLDAHEIPDRLFFMDEFPRSFIGKVLKQSLTDQFLS